MEDVIDLDRELFDVEWHKKFVTDKQAQAEESKRYFETAMYLCERGKHKMAQGYFAEASRYKSTGLSSLDLARLNCQLHHLNDADGVNEEAERWLSGFSCDPSHEKAEEETRHKGGPLTGSDDDSLSLFELLQKYPSIREFPGKLSTISDLCYRVLRAEAMYLKGEENRSIGELVEVVLSMKYSAAVAGIEKDGFEFCESVEMNGDAARWLVSELKRFCKEIIKITGDANNLDYVEWILSSIDSM